jgi:hypothetical protein
MEGPTIDTFAIRALNVYLAASAATEGAAAKTRRSQVPTPVAFSSNHEPEGVKEQPAVSGLFPVKTVNCVIAGLAILLVGTANDMGVCNNGTVVFTFHVTGLATLEITKFWVLVARPWVAVASVVAITEQVLAAVVFPAPVKVNTGDAELAIVQPVELAATTEYVIAPELVDVAAAKVKGLDTAVMFKVGDHVKVGVSNPSSIFILMPAPLSVPPYAVPKVAPTFVEPPAIFPAI